jgi:hypothetical protein
VADPNAAGERELEAYEELFSRAFTSRDPLAALRAARDDGATPAALREALSSLDEHGVRLSSLIVTRLRFERLLNGSREAGEWFERDPADFTAAFKRYQDQVPPETAFAQDEARAFEAWRRREEARGA